MDGGRPAPCQRPQRRSKRGDGAQPMSTGRRLRPQSPGLASKTPAADMPQLVQRLWAPGRHSDNRHRSRPMVRAAGVATGRLAAEVMDIARTGTAWAVPSPVVGRKASQESAGTVIDLHVCQHRRLAGPRAVERRGRSASGSVPVTFDKNTLCFMKEIGIWFPALPGIRCPYDQLRHDRYCGADAKWQEELGLH